MIFRLLLLVMLRITMSVISPSSTSSCKSVYPFSSTQRYSPDDAYMCVLFPVEYVVQWGGGVYAAVTIQTISGVFRYPGLLRILQHVSLYTCLASSLTVCTGST